MLEEKGKLDRVAVGSAKPISFIFCSGELGEVVSPDSWEWGGGESRTVGQEADHQ